MTTIPYEIAGRYLETCRRSGPQPPRGSRDAGGRRLLLIDASADAPVRSRPGADADAPSPHPLVRWLAPLAVDPTEVAMVVVLREDPAELDALQTALDTAGWGDRIHRTPAPPFPQEGEPSAVWLGEGNLATATAELLPLLDRATLTLVRAAPGAPAALPFPLTRTLVARPDTDLLLELPLGELHRLERFRTTPVADLPLHLRRMVEGWSAFLGDARLEWLALWRAVEAAEGTEAAQLRLVGFLEARLRQAVPDAVVRPFAVPLGNGAGKGTLHFVLATHEPTRVLHLNRILFELRSEGYLPWSEPADPLVRLENPGIIELFAAPGASVPEAGTEDPHGPRLRIVDTAQLADRLASQFVGQVVPLREAMHFLAQGELVPDDVHRALRLLRRERRVSYSSLSDEGALLRFHAPGSPPEAPLPPRRARNPRDESELDLW